MKNIDVSFEKTSAEISVSFAKDQKTAPAIFEGLILMKGDPGEKGEQGDPGKNGYSIFTTNIGVTEITDVTAIIDMAKIAYFDTRGFQRGDLVFDQTSGKLWRIDATSASQLALLLVFDLSGAVNSAAPVRIAEIELLGANWEGAESPYSQVVAIEGITPYSMVNLQPSVEQLAVFHDKDLAFVAENEDGVVTVFCIGDKPLLDYTMQVSITEVNA